MQTAGQSPEAQHGGQNLRKDGTVWTGTQSDYGKSVASYLTVKSYSS